MNLGFTVLLLASVANAEPLEAAHEAFQRGEYASAEALALAAAVPPREGEALYLVGLARFRAGHPATALEALDAAGQAADAPARGAWQFNRGACLYELGRFADAEAAYGDAAALDPALAPVALVNAGFAALDGGAPDRAAALAARARAVATGPALELVTDLEARIAGPAPSPAATGGTEEPSRAPSRVRGLAAKQQGWEATARLGGGVDTNVLQSGEQAGQERAPIATGATASALGTAGATVSWRRRLGEAWTVEVGYGLDQIAYADPAAADYSLQQHAAVAGAEWAPARRLRLGALASGQLVFTGLSDFRGLLGAATATAWLTFDESEATSTRVEGAWSRRTALTDEFAYLTGNRADAALAQELRLGDASLEVSYRHREERVGTLTQPAQLPLPYAACGMMMSCAEEYVIPFGYASDAAGLSVRARTGPHLQVGGALAYEWRRYLADSYLSVTALDGTSTVLDRRRRDDGRFTASAFGAWSAWRGLELVLRYDLVVNRSNVANATIERGACGPPDFSCHQLDYDDKNYTKHVITLEAGYGW